VKAIYAVPEPPFSAEGFTVNGTVTEVADELLVGIGFACVSTIHEFVVGEIGNTDALMEKPGFVKLETLILFDPLLTPCVDGALYPLAG
jgi:hypothetical protein